MQFFRMMLKCVLLMSITLIILLNTGCSVSKVTSSQTDDKSLVTANATRETVTLFHNLKKIMGKKVLFGQQDATSSGYGWNDASGRCDIKEACGSYPAFYSWDFMDFTRPDADNSAAESKIRKLTIEAYNRGGVNSYCWHFRNPITNGSFYDTSVIVVKHLLPGGLYNRKYKQMLTLVATYVKTLKGKHGELIPIIFRPYHEFDGNWFWWGHNFCTAEEFKQLYRFTVVYLRDSLKVTNLLYAFSPDCKFNTEAEYLERYPGDKYVDLLGMDNYWDFTSKGKGLDAVYKKLMIISNYAEKNNKLAALTETGLSALADSVWYTQKLLKVLKDYPLRPRLAYVAIWRNSTKGFYSPPPGHPALPDFNAFRKDPYILFEDDLPNMYKLK